MTDKQLKPILEVLNKLAVKIDRLESGQNDLKVEVVGLRNEISGVRNYIDVKADEIIAEIHLNKKYTDQSFQEISNLIKRVDILEAKVSRLAR